MLELSGLHIENNIIIFNCVNLHELPLKYDDNFEMQLFIHWCIFLRCALGLSLYDLSVYFCQNLF
jgi:hypothetical protein